MLKIGGLLVVLVVSVCMGSPAQLGLDAEGLAVVQGEAASICIPTPWGCIDLSDPSIRPRINAEGDLKANNDVVEAVDSEAEVKTTNINCIPTIWGCIDPTDPSIRPRTTDDEEQPITCKCIKTPFGCIDPCDPGIQPINFNTGLDQ